MAAPALVAQIQGQGSVSADNLNTYVQWCLAATALRSFIALPGMTVYALGAAVPDDGGQGTFYWLASVSESDDGLNYIVPPGASGGGWVRVGVIAGTFASLPTPTATNKGSRAFITDGAASPVFGGVAAGAGSLYTPVYSDGTNWRNG